MSLCLLSQASQHQAATQVVASIDAFCQRVRQGLAHATFTLRRQLVELLIDRVVVTDGDVEIHYVIPTTPASEYVRFSRLRTNYSHRLPRRPFLGQKALRAARVKLIDDRVVDRAQGMDAWTPDGRLGRQERLEQRPLAVGEVSGVEEKLSVHAPA